MPDIRDASVERAYVAEIRAVRYAELRTRVKGVLELVAVDEGQRVAAGKTIFAVNARAFKQDVLVARAAVLGAQAELEAAQLELQNTQVLQDKKVVSPAELAVATSKVQMARARLEQAKAGVERAAVDLASAEVKAPFDGVINRVPFKAGSTLAENDLLTTLTDTSEVFAYFRITEREYLEYANTAAKPSTVALQLVDGTRFGVSGTIDAIENELDRETGTLAYRARFANANGLLKHGSSGKVVIRTELKGVTVIPQQATFDVQGDFFVYVVDAQRVARARKVSVKARLENAFVVDGINAGERFVLEGVQKVKDGAMIEVAGPPTANAGAGG